MLRKGVTLATRIRLSAEMMFCCRAASAASVVKKVELTLVARTGERLLFSES